MMGRHRLWIALPIVFLALSGGSARASARADLPGASSKEREIRWAWKYLREFVVSCTASPHECQDPAMKGIASQLQQYLPDWDRATEWTSLLEFVSERERPGLFKVREGDSQVHLVLVTSKARNSKVFINTDRMMLPLTQWVGLLTHAAVHHLGYEDDRDRAADLIGSVIASHFQKQLVASDLEELRHPEARLVIFNSRAQGRAATGFFAVDFHLSDLDMGPATLQAFCEPGERFETQTSSVPFWRVSRIQYGKGLVSVRASSTTTITCLKPATSERANRKLAFVAEADMKYAPPIAPERNWWTFPSEFVRSSLRAGHTDSAAELITINRSFNVVSVSHASPSINAGQEWKTRILLKSLDGRAPRGCQVDMTGANWSYQRHSNLPATDTFQKCALTDVGESKWLIEASTVIPSNAQPDYFAIPLIRLATDDSDHFAIPKRPVYERVENPSAPAPLKAVAWRVLGLETLTSHAGRPLFNSHVADFNRPFWLEIDFEGSQEPRLGHIELNLIVSDGGPLIFVPRTLRADEPNETLLASETVKIPGGTRLRFQLQVPRARLAHDLRGFRFSRFYAPTSDFSWSELEIPSLSEGWVLERGSIQR